MHLFEKQQNSEAAFRNKDSRFTSMLTTTDHYWTHGNQDSSQSLDYTSFQCLWGKDEIEFEMPSIQSFWQRAKTTSLGLSGLRKWTFSSMVLSWWKRVRKDCLNAGLILYRETGWFGRFLGKNSSACISSGTVVSWVSLELALPASLSSLFPSRLLALLLRINYLCFGLFFSALPCRYIYIQYISCHYSSPLFSTCLTLLRLSVFSLLFDCASLHNKYTCILVTLVINASIPFAD